MFRENEIVMLIIGLGVLIFIISNRDQLKRLPSATLLLCSFYLLLAGWISTIVERICFNHFFNYLEHIFYAVSSALLTAWCWSAIHRKRGTTG